MGGAKITDLRKQLLKTLADLNQQGEFYIYSFNSRTEPMPHPGWLKAGAAGVEKIRTWVSDLNATGGTQPEPAFVAAFKLEPPPDIIFFMTDGLIPSAVPARVAALNTGRPKVVVNTIMFTGPSRNGVVPKGSSRGEAVLKEIAVESGGTFNQYVPKG